MKKILICMLVLCGTFPATGMNKQGSSSFSPKKKAEAQQRVEAIEKRLAARDHVG
jgi:hypothetical protein